MAVVTFPLDEVLELAALTARVEYGGYLVLRLAVDFHGQRRWEGSIGNGVRSMGLQEGHVEDGMQESQSSGKV